MTIRRRQFLQLAGSIAIPGISRLAYALDYPIRSVRVIVPFVAGGATDIAGRLISQWLSAPDRIVFGRDWPFCNDRVLAEEVAA